MKRSRKFKFYFFNCNKKVTSTMTCKTKPLDDLNFERVLKEEIEKVKNAKWSEKIDFCVEIL